MKSLSQCDYSAQEVMQHLLSLKLVSCSFNVVPITLNGSCRIKVKEQMQILQLMTLFLMLTPRAKNMLKKSLTLLLSLLQKITK